MNKKSENTNYWKGWTIIWFKDPWLTSDWHVAFRAIFDAHLLKCCCYRLHYFFPLLFLYDSWKQEEYKRNAYKFISWQKNDFKNMRGSNPRTCISTTSSQYDFIQHNIQPWGRVTFATKPTTVCDGIPSWFQSRMLDVIVWIHLQNHSSHSVLLSVSWFLLLRFRTLCCVLLQKTFLKKREIRCI